MPGAMMRYATRGAMTAGRIQRALGQRYLYSGVCDRGVSRNTGSSRLPILAALAGLSGTSSIVASHDTSRSPVRNAPGAHAWQQALTILNEVDHPDAKQVRAKLAGLDPPTEDTAG
jgi:hypothetical protein